MPAAPDPADIHGGDPADVIAASMTEAFDAVVQAISALDLRPTAVEVHRQLGLVDVAVYFPHGDTDAVDALADRFRLPSMLDAGVMYCRRGLAEAGPFSLAVRSTRPGNPLPDPVASALAELGDTPRVITGEIVAVPAGKARGELVIP